MKRTGKKNRGEVSAKWGEVSCKMGGSVRENGGNCPNENRQKPLYILDFYAF